MIIVLQECRSAGTLIRNDHRATRMSLRRGGLQYKMIIVLQECRSAAADSDTHWSSCYRNVAPPRRTL